MSSTNNIHHLRAVKPLIKTKEQLARVIAISSGKGGVGKSSVSLNLAIELSLKKIKSVYLMRILIWRISISW